MFFRTKAPRSVVDKTAIVKDREAHALHDRNSVFDRKPDQRVAADRLSIFILRTGLTESEAAQRIHTAQVEAVIDWYYVIATPGCYGRNFTVQQKNRVERQVIILSGIQIEPI